MENIDLQLFAEDKTEEATPKKRKDARKKGQVAKTKELSSGLSLICCAVVLRYGFGWISEGVLRLMTYSFELDHLKISNEGILNLSSFTIQRMLLGIGPIMGVVVISGLLGYAVQTGMVVSTQVLVPDLNRINPISGIQKVFSKRAVVELFKSVGKLGAISFIIYYTLISEIEMIVRISDLSVREGSYIIGDIAWTLAFRVGLFLIILSGFDYLYQRYEHETQIKMTRQEVKDEYKQVEGDPVVKSAIRRKQQEVMTRRMMSEISTASVVITNPKHIAVVLRYNPPQDSAPLLIAKGAGFIAFKIKELAREHDVPIVENPPLARMVYKRVDIDDVIPVDLYKAIAEVLAFVYKLKGKKLR